MRSLWLGNGGPCQEIPVFRHPPTSKKWQPGTITSGFSLRAFPSNCFALCLKRRTASIPGLDKGNSLSCKIADDIRDDLNNDRVLKGCRSAERSTISARQTAMT